MFAPGSLFKTVVHSFLAATLAAALWLLPAETQAQSRRERADPGTSINSPQVLSAFRAVVAQPSASTVHLLCKGKEVALGTIVGADGWILTKYSQLAGPVTCILKDERRLTARLVGVEEAYDLALLKVDAKDLKPVQWADSKSAVEGNFVATPGTGSEPLHVGVVSVAARKVTARDLPPVRNNSGFLGIGLDKAEKGVKITDVQRGSAASRAGFKVGDVVIAVAGKTVTQPDALIEAVQRYKVGDEVAIRIRRGTEELELKPILQKRKGSERSDFQNELGNELSNRRGGFPSILQHDTVLKPTECGGPLIDLDGKAVGINIARAGRVETYAVPVDAVLAVLPNLKAGKLPPPELKEAEANVVAARAALNRAETALKELQKRIKDTNVSDETTETELRVAQNRVKDARDALQEALNELKAFKE